MFVLLQFEAEEMMGWLEEKEQLIDLAAAEVGEPL